jgi:hypothetical protein
VAQDKSWTLGGGRLLRLVGGGRLLRLLFAFLAFDERPCPRPGGSTNCDNRYYRQLRWRCLLAPAIFHRSNIRGRDTMLMITVVILHSKAPIIIDADDHTTVKLPELTVICFDRIANVKDWKGSSHLLRR